jgi:Leucine-rich repeat (LRR) protein
LEVIYLAFNRIKFIHKDTFKGLENLYVLDLSSNSLRTVDKVFDELFLLLNLDLSSNKIESIHKNAFKNLYNLRKLVISKNNIKFINHKVFDPLVNLKYFDFCFNQSPIDVIDGKFLSKNVYLVNILLCSNRINAIDRKFFSNEKKNLEIVLLRGSRCTNEDVSFKSGKTNEEEFSKLKICFDNYKD